MVSIIESLVKTPLTYLEADPPSFATLRGDSAQPAGLSAPKTESKMQTNKSRYSEADRSAAIARLNVRQQARNIYTQIGDDEIKREIQRFNRNQSRRDRDQVMRDCGLVRVVGALGGVYWE